MRRADLVINTEETRDEDPEDLIDGGGEELGGSHDPKDGVKQMRLSHDIKQRDLYRSADGEVVKEKII